MQECFLRAILSLPDDHGNMRAWLYRVARNLLKDQLRSRREGVSLDELEETPSDAPEPLGGLFLFRQLWLNTLYVFPVHDIVRRHITAQ